MTTELMLNNVTGMAIAKSAYSEEANAFLSNGYISAANNTYFNAVRFAEGIVIKEDIGQGYFHTFLNGLRIYSLKDSTLLADKTFHCCYYSKSVVQREAREMLQILIKEAIARTGSKIDAEESNRVIAKILAEAFDSNQLEYGLSQLKRIG
jgi:hypothetical protein